MRYWLILLILYPIVAFGDATTNLLLQDGDITYVGSFSVSSTGFGTSYGGTSLAVSADGVYLYIGTGENETLGMVTIPSPIAGTATTYLSPQSVPGSVGGSNPSHIAGVLVYNNRLIVQKRVPYDGDGSASKAVSAGNTNVSGFSSFYGNNSGEYGQTYSGYMGSIPTEWQTLLGGPAFMGNSSQSIISVNSSGPSMMVFDPDDVGVEDPVPVNVLMLYSIANPITNPDVTNNIWTRADQQNAGMFIASGTRSLIFVSKHGYGTPNYKEAPPDDPCDPGDGGEQAYPYRRQVTAFDLNDLVDVKNSVIEPYEVQPYAWWTMPGPTDSCGSFGYSGLAYDDNNRRIYATPGWGDGETGTVYVYSVAELTGGAATTTVSGIVGRPGVTLK